MQHLNRPIHRRVQPQIICFTIEIFGKKNMFTFPIIYSFRREEFEESHSFIINKTSFLLLSIIIRSCRSLLSSSSINCCLCSISQFWFQYQLGCAASNIMFSTVSNLLLGSGGGGETADEPHIATVDPNSEDDAAMTAFEIEFWKNYDDDMFGSPMPFDASEGGLWNGRFVPPPPRPPFMDDAVVTDGLTTCDLCTWAFQDKSAFSLEGSLGKSVM